MNKTVHKYVKIVFLITFILILFSTLNELIKNMGRVSKKIADPCFRALLFKTKQ